MTENEKKLDPSKLQAGQALRFKPAWSWGDWMYVRYIRYEDDYAIHRLQYWNGPDGQNSYTFGSTLEKEHWELADMTITPDDLATPIWWASHRRPHNFIPTEWTVADLVGSAWRHRQYDHLCEDLRAGFDSHKRINLYSHDGEQLVTVWLDADEGDEAWCCITAYKRFDTEPTFVKQRYFRDRAIAKYREAQEERHKQQAASMMSQAHELHGKYIREGGERTPLFVLVNKKADIGDQLILM